MGSGEGILVKWLTTGSSLAMVLWSIPRGRADLAMITYRTAAGGNRQGKGQCHRGKAAYPKVGRLTLEEEIRAIVQGPTS